MLTKTALCAGGSRTGKAGRKQCSREAVNGWYELFPFDTEKSFVVVVVVVVLVWQTLREAYYANYNSSATLLLLFIIIRVKSIIIFSLKSSVILCTDH